MESTMNNSLHKLVMIFLSAIMLVVSGFLVAEYRFFKLQAEQLEQLRDDYSQHIVTLKRRMQDYQVSDTSKKKNQLTEQTKRLLLVNRAVTHLKKSAVSFARSHNLDYDVHHLYDGTLPVRKHSKRKHRSQNVAYSRRRSKKSFSDVMPADAHWKKMKRDPIFSSPIERQKFWLSSPYGPRKNPNGTWGFHAGIDMAAPKGTPVTAAGEGTVVEATYAQGYGNTIVIEHDRNMRTRYAHLDKIFVHVGQKVQQGTFIGKVGATGFVRKSRRGGDASHLHFEVYVNGKHSNPFNFLA